MTVNLYIQVVMNSLPQAFVITLVGLALLTSCSSNDSSKLSIKKHTSIGQNDRVQSLILHFTAGNYKRSLFALKESGAVSSHYLIPDPNDDSYTADKLQVIQLVEEDKRAWHAGHSYWQGRHNLNDSSIGIEIVNRPDCRQEEVPENVYFRGGEYGMHMSCDFPKYSQQQIELLVELTKDILKRNPDISPTRVIGHSDIAPARKSDPGPSFPWFELYKKGVGAWYDSETYDWYFKLFEQHKPATRLVQKAFHFYGYQIEQTGNWDEQMANVLYAFQSHFLPKQANGELTLATMSALFSLIDKYQPELLKVLLEDYFYHAELTYSKQLDESSPAYRKWLIVNAKEQVYSFKAKSLQADIPQQLTLVVNGKWARTIKLPKGISEMTVPLELSKGRHLIELKSSQNIEHASIHLTPKEQKI